jgi:hypothetical protein
MASLTVIDRLIFIGRASTIRGLPAIERADPRSRIARLVEARRN